MCSLTLGIMEAGDRAAKMYTCRSSSARLGSLQGRWVTPDNCHVSRKDCILPLPAKSGSGRVGMRIYWESCPQAWKTCMSPLHDERNGSHSVRHRRATHVAETLMAFAWQGVS